ncbi:uncharacterized protein LOC144129548 [Amblyomma americanum]
MREAKKFRQYVSPTSQCPVPAHAFFHTAVSVTLKGRWFTPASGGSSNLDLFKRCNDLNQTRDADPSSLCTSSVTGNFRFDQTHKSSLFVSGNRVLTFDTEEALKAKLCAAKAKFVDVDFGIAAYDVDADLHNDPCPKAKYNCRYRRVMLLRKLRDFFEMFFKSAADQSACESIK